MLMRYFEKAVLGKPPATSGKQIFVGKSQVYVCLFTCTRCGPPRERAFYSSLLTST